jgi:accessory gene regulator protein AgrB
MWFITFVSTALWAPADTPKKPIINKKKRIFDKIITLLLATILLFISFISSNTLINNSIFFAYIMGTVAICPLTYKIFGIPYNNYKNF